MSIRIAVLWILGSGPKLVGADLTFVDPSKKLFDTLDLSLHNWGGDPYNTLRVNARKQGIYNILADYRNMTYFNNLPSFANPLLVQGNLISQRAFDTQRRYANFGTRSVARTLDYPVFLLHP